MKPTTTIKKQHTAPHRQRAGSSRPTPRRVAINFLPHAGWQVEIGRIPTKAFVTPQTGRDNETPTGYKRGCGSSHLTHVFVPVELVMAAATQRAAPRRNAGRATL